MMIPAELLFVANQVLQASDSDGDDFWSYGIVFLFAGFVFYGYMYIKYRNTDKRHMHEKETRSVRVNEEGDQRFVKRMKGLDNSTMKGANNREVRAALNKAGKSWMSNAANLPGLPKT